MVAAKPDFREVGEAVVVRDLGGRQMAVVIIDRLGLRVGVVELAGSRI